LDYGAPKARVGDYMRNESRFRTIERVDPARYKRFVDESQAAAERRFAIYQQLSGIKVPAFEQAAVGVPPQAKPENPPEGEWGSARRTWECGCRTRWWWARARWARTSTW